MEYIIFSKAEVSTGLLQLKSILPDLISRMRIRACDLVRYYGTIYFVIGIYSSNHPTVSNKMF